LVIKQSNTKQQSFHDKAMELEKKIEAIGQPPGKINKFYR
jgi:hypothetical protein